jgi:TRAP-type transport system periplasmic protein
MAQMRALGALMLLVSVARADQVLRIGTIVPDGTAWAREVKALGREVETETRGGLRMKWFMGGVAGDEMEMAERVKRGQLDGILSGSVLCEKLAPSLQVARIPGMFQNWEETSNVIGQLKSVLDKEFEQAGYVNIGEVLVGPSILFTRKPVASVADFKGLRLWTWHGKDAVGTFLKEIGAQAVPMDIHDAARAYDQGKHDGFIAPAAAALGFRWSALVRYHTDVRLGFVVGCLVIATRAFDTLPIQARQALRSAAANAQVRSERLARAQEAELLGGLFRKQGVQPVEVNDTFRSQFFQTATAIRERTAARFVPAKLIQRVLAMLADFRSEHR